MKFSFISSFKSENEDSGYPPIHVRSCGHYSTDTYFRDNPLKKNFLELFWGVRGAAQFRFQGKTLLLQEKTVFFYLPGDLHDIVSHTLPMEYYWLTLNGPNVSFLIEQFHLRQELRVVEPCPIYLFQQLEQQMRTYTIRGEYLAGAIAYHILSLIATEPLGGKNLLERFQEFIAQHYMDSALDMPMIAKALGVHRSTLNRCIFQLCGITPSEYIHAFRMQEAFRLLQNPEMSVKEVALAVGFEKSSYFAKVVRHHFGETPSELRCSKPSTLSDNCKV